MQVKFEKQKKYFFQAFLEVGEKRHQILMWILLIDVKLQRQWIKIEDSQHEINVMTIDPQYQYLAVI